MPRVSIITPLHDKGPYIGETIRSVLAQTMEDWEMIVVENGSIDDGPEIAAAFNDPRIRMEILDGKGPGAARNLGVRAASGDWILFLDADDLIEPSHLEGLLACASGAPSAGIVAGGWKTFRDGDKHLMETHHASQRNWKRDEFVAGALALTPWVLHAAIVRRELVSGEKLWPEELDPYPDEDTAFWFPLILGSEVAWSAGAGALYRTGLNESRSASEDLAHRLHGYDRIIGRNLFMMGGGDPVIPKYRWFIALMYEVGYLKACSAGHHKVAIEALKSAETWLKKAPFTLPSVLIRRILGIRNVCRLRRFLGRIR